MYLSHKNRHFGLTYRFRIFIRKSAHMYTKLTLNLDKSVIEEAKAYAKSQKVSLSRLVESYLSSLVRKERDLIAITPFVENLSGVISLDRDYDVKKDYSDHLAKKHK